MYHLTKFDDIMQGGFSVIRKIASGNLCKSIHDINSSSTHHSECEKCGKDEKNVNIFRTKRAIKMK